MTEQPQQPQSALFLASSPRGAIKLIEAASSEDAAIDAAKDWARASYIVVHPLGEGERFVPQTELKVTGVERG